MISETTSHKKLYRHRYFLVEIQTGLEIYQISKLLPSMSALQEALQKIKFITQKGLETTLSEFMSSEQTPKIKFLNFIGQLEQKTPETPPYWKIFCETSAPTTAISLARAFSQQLFSREDSNLVLQKNSIDSRIKVRSQPEFQRLQPEFQLFIPDSEWTPGYLNHKLSLLLEVIEDLEMSQEILLRTIQERPKVRNRLLNLGKAIMRENEVKRKPLEKKPNTFETIPTDILERESEIVYLTSEVLPKMRGTAPQSRLALLQESNPIQNNS